MPMFVMTKGYVEMVGVVPVYVHLIITCEQVVRLGTVEKTIPAVVDICAKVRRGGSKGKLKLPLQRKCLPCG